MQRHLAFVLALTSSWFPKAVWAQPDVCAVAGEYVLSASVAGAPGPGQVSGTLVFTPPEACGSAAGTVAVDVQLVTTAGVVTPYRADWPYTVVGTSVVIGGGALRGTLTDVARGVATSIPVSGDADAGITGSLLKRPAHEPGAGASGALRR
ncbi:MAG: hypothetical protein R2745_00210 [Vicinamibacterales bacterium]